MEVINSVLGYKELKIIQNNEWFAFSLDSVLLANFVSLKKNIKKILDLGTGNAPIPIILSTKTDAQIFGVELQKKVYKLAARSVELNNLENQITILNDDIRQVHNKFDSETFDLIISNPPYFKFVNNSNINNNDIKSIARHEIFVNLENIMVVAKKLLKNGGSIALVHRPERMVEIIEEMKKNNIEPKKIRFVYPKRGKMCNLILIEGVKNGNNGIKILPPLFLHTKNGQYTKEVKNMFQ